MIKKRVIILFFIFFISNLYGNDKLIENWYNNEPKEFFAKGIISNNHKEIPIAVYIEKNNDKYFNMGVYIDEKLLLTKSEELEDFFKLDSNKVSSFENIPTTQFPIELINYPLRNRTFTEIENSNTFEYKGLKSSKILILDKINEIETITDESNTIINGIDNSNETLTTSKENNPNVKEYQENSFEKMVYIITNESNVILRKEFYKKRNDRTPQFIMDVKSINYIEGFYIADKWLLTEKKSNQTIEFSYNIETILYNKQDVSNNIKKITSFYGVK